MLSPFRKNRQIIAFSILVVAMMVVLAQCVTLGWPAPCPTAHEVMAKRGTVIDCYPKFFPDSREWADACLVLPPNGPPTEMVVFPHHCGL